MIKWASLIPWPLYGAGVRDTNNFSGFKRNGVCTHYLENRCKGWLEKGLGGFSLDGQDHCPCILFTALLEFSGLLDALNFVLEPAMGLLNLPSIAALPLVVGMLSGIYTGIAAMIVLPLTTNQMTLIAVFLMISHNLVQEGIIQAKSGLGALKATLIRLAASVITVIVVSWFLGGYSKAAAAAAETISHSPAFFGMLEAWFTATLLLSIKLFIIIISIMILLEIMRIYHIITYMVKILTPVLKIMGLEKGSASCGSRRLSLVCHMALQ